MDDAGERRLAWTSWPARERPLAAALGLAAVAGFGAAGAAAGGHWGIGLACAAALIAALHRFYFPVRCAVTEREATVRSLLGSRSMALSGVRRIAHDARLVLLSSRSAGRSPGPRDLILPLPPADGESLVRALGQLVGAASGGTPRG